MSTFQVQLLVRAEGEGLGIEEISCKGDRLSTE